MTEMDKPLPTPFARARLIYTHKRFGFNRRKITLLWLRMSNGAIFQIRS